MGSYEYTMGKELDLKAEQEKTLAAPALRSNVILKVMYWTMDKIYGPKPSLPKVKVLEILARYPYWAWENGGYRGLTRLHAATWEPRANDIQRYKGYIQLGRKSQDNEEYHMLILEDIIAQKGMELGWLTHYLLPRVMAFVYYYLSRIIFYLSPAMSFYMNAAFESHAEHEYMKFAQAHPEWDEEPVESKYFDVYYPRQRTLGDLLRRIALDERDHMYASLEEWENLRT